MFSRVLTSTCHSPPLAYVVPWLIRNYDSWIFLRCCFPVPLMPWSPPTTHRPSIESPAADDGWVRPLTARLGPHFWNLESLSSSSWYPIPPSRLMQQIITFLASSVEQVLTFFKWSLYSLWPLAHTVAVEYSTPDPVSFLAPLIHYSVDNPLSS